MLFAKRMNRESRDDSSSRGDVTSPSTKGLQPSMSLFAIYSSTLRNDIEGAESPLAVYPPGQPGGRRRILAWMSLSKLFGLSSIRTKVKTFPSIAKTAEERTQ
jgi:hypothetical protein